MSNLNHRVVSVFMPTSMPGTQPSSSRLRVTARRRSPRQTVGNWVTQLLSSCQGEDRADLWQARATRDSRAKDGREAEAIGRRRQRSGARARRPLLLRTATRSWPSAPPARRRIDKSSRFVMGRPAGSAGGGCLPLRCDDEEGRSALAAFAWLALQLLARCTQV